ncbi:(E3-independent) E2 ubiquitin-conjugating enzyme UBE2O isoform X1 [Anastrepha ludens]|uniref:(E3-independent) E2 ubiquitin-conjugating enzyme UBE2O isoform X1 n=1 Tax=Anastrepha ludens TaxID=28586 RepID=UPI0023AF07F7|nr:(E3-independent) E2 ubiquitin-conjugating enzyme UBE2O isoform X1 [Anastrepha ludens]
MDHIEQKLGNDEPEQHSFAKTEFPDEAPTSSESVKIRESDCDMKPLGSSIKQDDADTEQKTPVPVGGDRHGSSVDNRYFYEDEVFHIDKRGRVKFGLVIGTSEAYDGDEEDDVEGALLKGEVRVAWYSEGKEEVREERAIGLADRTLIPSDVVRRLVPGKETQRGYCRDIRMHADVKVLGTKYVIKNVMTERLRPINYWQGGSAVCLDSWVGSTRDVEEKAVLRSAAGARIEISSNMFHAFSDYNTLNTTGIFDPHVFFPGNVVVGRLQSLDSVKLLTPNIPIHKNKKGKALKGRYTIESVETTSVWVDWQCKALSDATDIDAALLEQPNPCVSGEDLQRLKRLNLFESCMPQISDRNYLKFSSLDTCIKKSQWGKDLASKFKEEFAQIQKTIEDLDIQRKKNKPSSVDVDSKRAKPKKSTSKLDKPSSADSKEETSPHETSVEQGASNLQTKETSGSNVEPEWVTDEEDEEDDEDEYFFNDDFYEDGVSTTTCSTPSPHHSPKPSKRHFLKKKSKAPTKRAPSFMIPEFQPKDGDELVTEVGVVFSTATVVWQDGTVEADIPSTQLYPIHHLDNHEFFPGDFVTSGKEGADTSYRNYGVVQMVDHQGRTARVKWFTTYTSADEPRPTYNGETEVSVYDLKDHADFQYRPGTMVIRVANFVGEDATCTAGQIIDNYTDGRTKVWWVDGHISMCWPQDLFEVGQNEYADWGQESEDSWETESENSELGGSTPMVALEESQVMWNIERTRVAIARLEEIFSMSPKLQNVEVMRNLLNVYKGCRYLDRLMNTSFFHEDNFMGLIERVRIGGSQAVAERAQDRKNRLYNYVPATSPNVKQHMTTHAESSHLTIVSCTCPSTSTHSNLAAAAASKKYAPKIIFNISRTPYKTPSNTGNVPGAATGSSASGSLPMLPPVVKLKSSTATATMTLASSQHNSFEKAGGTQLAVADEEPQTVHNTDSKTVLSHQQNIIAQNSQLIHSAMLNIEKAFEKTCQIKSVPATSQLYSLLKDDSGNYSRNENCDGSSTSYASYSDLTNADGNGSLTKVNDDQKSISCSSIEFNEDAPPEMDCVRLCSLLKEQLIKCIQQIREKFYQGDNLNLNEVFGFDDNERSLSGEAVVLSEEKSAKGNEEGKPNVVEKKFQNLKKADVPVERTDSATESQDSIVSSPVSPMSLVNVASESFQVLALSPSGHKYQLTIFHPHNTQQYYRAVQREHRMLKSSLPPGVWVKIFEDRIDLLSVMIEGPKKTPYEDGLFFFDIQLGPDYPKSPPLCHYISYCSDRLNPNLYEDGKVCVSLLGTWAGRDSEVWGPNSTLLQVIVSIQGLILVPEPYFNEAGYDKQKGSQQGSENSRMYNEMVIIKMVQSSTKLLQQPPELFRREIYEHWKQRGFLMYERIKGWMELSKSTPNNQNEVGKTKCAVEEEVYQPEQSNLTAVIPENVKINYAPPDFPLVPASRGFCLTLVDLIETFKMKLVALSTERKQSMEKDDAATIIKGMD